MTLHLLAAGFALIMLLRHGPAAAPLFARGSDPEERRRALPRAAAAAAALLLLAASLLYSLRSS